MEDWSFGDVALDGTPGEYAPQGNPMDEFGAGIGLNDFNSPVLLSPPGVMAPVDEWNFTADDGTVSPPWKQAPIGKMNYSFPGMDFTPYFQQGAFDVGGEDFNPNERPAAGRDTQASLSFGGLGDLLGGAARGAGDLLAGFGASPAYAGEQDFGADDFGMDELGLGAPAAQPSDNGASTIARAARAAGLDMDGTQVALAIAHLENGLTGLVGDDGNAFGPYQFHTAGMLPAYAASLGMSVSQAGEYARTHPEEAARWALQGYLGDAIKQGQQMGLSGANLAIYVQQNGQRSRSPEVAGQTYNGLFGQRNVGQDWLASAGNFLAGLGAGTAYADEWNNEASPDFASMSDDELDAYIGGQLNQGTESGPSGGTSAQPGATPSGEPVPPSTGTSDGYVSQDGFNTLGQQHRGLVGSEIIDPFITVATVNYFGETVKEQRPNPDPQRRYTFGDGTYLIARTVTDNANNVLGLNVTQPSTALSKSQPTGTAKLEPVHDPRTGQQIAWRDPATGTVVNLPKIEPEPTPTQNLEPVYDPRTGQQIAWRDPAKGTVLSLPTPTKPTDRAISGETSVDVDLIKAKSQRDKDVAEIEKWKQDTARAEAKVLRDNEQEKARIAEEGRRFDLNLKQQRDQVASQIQVAREANVSREAIAKFQSQAQAILRDKELAVQRYLADQKTALERRQQSDLMKIERAKLALAQRQAAMSRYRPAGAARSSDNRGPAPRSPYGIPEQWAYWEGR